MLNYYFAFSKGEERPQRVSINCVNCKTNVRFFFVPAKEVVGSKATTGTNYCPIMMQLVPQHGPPIELKPGSNIILGRGVYGITDRRVSRKQAELIVSKETNNVSLTSVRCSHNFFVSHN